MKEKYEAIKLMNILQHLIMLTKLCLFYQQQAELFLLLYLLHLLMHQLE